MFLNTFTKTFRFLRLIFAAYLLAVAGWGIYYAHATLSQLLVSAASIRFFEVLGSMFAPIIVMAILLLLPWSAIRSQWIWWPLFLLLSWSALVHLDRFYLSRFPGIERCMPQFPFVWPACLYLGIVGLQLAGIALTRVRASISI